MTARWQSLSGNSIWMMSPLRQPAEPLPTYVLLETARGRHIFRNALQVDAAVEDA
jgi:hypothetical protein